VADAEVAASEQRTSSAPAAHEQRTSSTREASEQRTSSKRADISRCAPAVSVYDNNSNTPISNLSYSNRGCMSLGAI